MSPVQPPVPVRFTACDGVHLAGDFWSAYGDAQCAVIINAATGVLARYYHRYARFLAQNGVAVLTWDYRGIGASRPENLRQSGYRWYHWGERDFAAAVTEMGRLAPRLPLHVVGHSIGGYLPGLAENSDRIRRMLTVGAQYAYFPDYAPKHRTRLFLKWHIAMPLLTAAFGYFPGRRLGWLEDLPAGVAYEWSFRRSRAERSFPPQIRERLLANFARVDAQILALSLTDDPFGTPRALNRTLQLYKHAQRTMISLEPSAFGQNEVGHFSLFNARNEGGFWRQTLRWLQQGENPWPGAVTALVDVP